MENAVDALKMAFGVLVFVLAITITISTFSNATRAVNKIKELREEDRSFVKYTDENGEEKYLNYINYSDDNVTREVGVETIMPTLYRARVEQIEVYFIGNDVSIFETDSEISQYFESANIDGRNGFKLSYERDPQNTIDNIARPLYRFLAGRTVEEKVGQYYSQDEGGVNENTTEENKTYKRIIVYNIK